jgi:2-polyprenyl-3-methyl-5-hydroxy-6-metoxy-1,4-benzoquinol methylase
MQAARDYRVTADIHYDDYIFNTLYMLKGKNLESGARHYYLSGRTSAEKIRDIVALHRHMKLPLDRLDMPISILDFASGYGCVSRHMRNVFPNSNVVAMDIHEKAYYFNTENLGVKAAISRTQPEDVETFFEFDVVFALSFFSHIPKKGFSRG